MRRSTKLSGPPLYSVSADKGTKESTEVRGLRPNSSSKGVMFEGREASGKVRLIQIAGDTYSPHLSGHERHKSAKSSSNQPANLSTAP